MMLLAALTALLSLADATQAARLQEAVADCLCALASHEGTREKLAEAGNNTVEGLGFRV